VSTCLKPDRAVKFVLLMCGYRQYCRRRRRTCITVTRLATFQQVTCMRLTTEWSWSFGRGFRCLAAGRPTTTSDTTFPATSISITVVSHCMVAIFSHVSFQISGLLIWAVLYAIRGGGFSLSLNALFLRVTVQASISWRLLHLRLGVRGKLWVGFVVT